MIYEVESNSPVALLAGADDRAVSVPVPDYQPGMSASFRDRQAPRIITIDAQSRKVLPARLNVRRIMFAILLALIGVMMVAAYVTGHREELIGFTVMICVTATVGALLRI